MSRHMKSMPASASTTVTSGEPMRVPERGPLFRQPAAGKVRARAFARECSKFFWHQSRALPASPPPAVHTAPFTWKGPDVKARTSKRTNQSPVDINLPCGCAARASCLFVFSSVSVRSRASVYACTRVRACALALARACAVIEQVDARHGASSGAGRSKTWRGACRWR